MASDHQRVVMRLLGVMIMYTKDHAERLKPHAGKKWRPANGHEGDIFYTEYCSSCELDANGGEYAEDGCQIIPLTMIHDVGDDEYPVEWQISEHGQPECTAYKCGKASA